MGTNSLLWTPIRVRGFGPRLLEEWFMLLRSRTLSQTSNTLQSSAVAPFLYFHCRSRIKEPAHVSYPRSPSRAGAESSHARRFNCESAVRSKECGFLIVACCFAGITRYASGRASVSCWPTCFSRSPTSSLIPGCWLAHYGAELPKEFLAKTNGHLDAFIPRPSHLLPPSPMGLIADHLCRPAALRVNI